MFYQNKKQETTEIRIGWTNQDVTGRHHTNAPQQTLPIRNSLLYQHLMENGNRLKHNHFKAVDGQVYRLGERRDLSCGMLASGGAVVEGAGFPYHMAAGFREFLRPLPKSEPPQAPVNLTHKEDTPEEYSYPPPPPPPPPPPHRMFPPGAAAFPQLGYGPYGTLYPAPYTPVMRPHPLDAYPRYAASPPHSPLVKTKPLQPPPPPLVPHQVKPRPPADTGNPFKAPPGKEGSLKHRILRKKATGPVAPATASFNRGSLIQLANGELKRVEDMRTEDFINSAQQSTAHRLDPSTVVRIDNPNEATTLLTLSYGQTRSQVH
ncbi:hypothetical protein AAG570_013737 [Ranatra chinensis]|uniref:AXH domain-containing protein n=1 Tax=Ranatra chinensis TaxID=642074 RepID=A0ABD0YPN4_9HEMI